MEQNIFYKSLVQTLHRSKAVVVIIIGNRGHMVGTSSIEFDELTKRFRDISSENSV